MKGYRSAILNEQGAPLDDQQELAHVIAMAYASAGPESFLSSKKQKRYIGFACAALAIVFFALIGVLGGAGVVLGLIGLGIGGLFLAKSYMQKPKFRVTKLGKGYWVGGLYDFEGGKLLVDKSQLTDSVRFEVPVPNITPEEMVQVAAEAKQLIQSPPIMMRRASGLTLEQEADPMTLLVERLNYFSAELERSQAETLDLNVLPAESALSTALLKQADGAEVTQPRNALVGAESERMDAHLRHLAGMTSISRERTREAKTVEQLAEETAGEFEVLVKTLDDIHRTSLVEILQKQLGLLERAYRAPTLLYHCPRCLRSKSRDLRVNLEKALSEAVDDDAQLVEGGAAARLSETVAEFAAVSRAAIMKLELRPGNERLWRCGLCNNTYDIGQADIIQSHIAKQYLVLPLWDQLWMELSSERAGLLERKDKEQRDNMQTEHREVVHTMDQFSAERREVGNRMESLRERTIRAVEVYSSLIDSFIGGGILAAEAVRGEAATVKRYRQEYLDKLDQMKDDISQIEGEFVTERDATLERRKPLLDFAEQVKLKTQFIPKGKEGLEEITLE